MVDKITPDDSRVQTRTAQLNGVTYSYLLAEPQSTPALGSIFLIHGWPDLSLGWRYQIPLLLSLNLRVVVPDMMGYGGTDAPTPLSYYTYKRAAADVAALAAHLGVSRIILGGHDWGGAVVYRIALWQPQLIAGVFSICTPFWAPKAHFAPLTKMPNFKYQIQLGGPDVEREVAGEDRIRQFLNGLYGGRTGAGQLIFDVSHGCHFDRLEHVGPSPLLTTEEMEYYVQRYKRNGMRGPLNWYRTAELNFEEDQALVAAHEKETGNDKSRVWLKCPVLFVAGSRDAALPPHTSEGMDRYFADLRREEVDSGHWMLWEKPAEVNALIKEFVEGLLKGSGQGEKSHL